MNPLIQLKTITPPLLITFALLCFGLLPGAQAVVPPPDGGYPGFNTAEGQNALFSLTTGSANTAVGWFSLFSNTEESFNTGTGAGALLFNTANENTAFGAAALLFNASGSSNAAVGSAALLNNTTGSANTAIGNQALLGNTTGGNNTATGSQALRNNTSGSFNTANGAFALVLNTGDSNTAFGDHSLGNNTTGSNNIGLGEQAGGNVTTASNVICIGVPGVDVDNSCFIGHIFGATLVGTATAVFVNQNGQLGTMTSSRRFKEEIEPMEQASATLFALKPVTFRYKKEIDPAGISQFGLVAEDVDKVDPDLVVRDKEGKAYSVRYDQVNAMLLNEFLKEHKKVEMQSGKIEEQGATIAELKREIANLCTTVKEQATQIQKVSAHIEMNERASQTVAKR